MSSPRPFEPIPAPTIGIGSRLLVGHYPNEPATVIGILEWPPGNPVTYHVRISENRSAYVGGGERHPAIPWLWTPNHHRWVGADPEPLAPYIPSSSTKCFGPPLCETCAVDLETMRSGSW